MVDYSGHIPLGGEGSFLPLESGLALWLFYDQQNMEEVMPC